LPNGRAIPNIRRYIYDNSAIEKCKGVKEKRREEKRREEKRREENKKRREDIE